VRLNNICRWGLADAINPHTYLRCNNKIEKRSQNCICSIFFYLSTVQIGVGVNLVSQAYHKAEDFLLSDFVPGKRAGDFALSENKNIG